LVALLSTDSGWRWTLTAMASKVRVFDNAMSSRSSFIDQPVIVLAARRCRIEYHHRWTGDTLIDEHAAVAAVSEPRRCGRVDLLAPRVFFLVGKARLSAMGRHEVVKPWRPVVRLRRRGVNCEDPRASLRCLSNTAQFR
jgi:hypothetical protein